MRIVPVLEVLLEKKWTCISVLIGAFRVHGDRTVS